MIVYNINIYDEIQGVNRTESAVATDEDMLIEIVEGRGIGQYTYGVNWFETMRLAVFGHNLSDKQEFFEFFAFMLEMGHPIMSVVDSYKENRATKLQNMANLINTRLEAGLSFTEAVSDTNFFTPSEMMMIDVGEESGQLPEILNLLGEYTNRMIEMRNKTKQAMQYPAVLLVLSLAVMYAGIFIILPQMADKMSYAIEDMPAVSQAALDFGAWVEQHWTFSVTVGAGFVALLVFIYVQFRMAILNFCLYVPKLGNFIEYRWYEQFFVQLRVMLHSGITIHAAIDHLHREQTQPYFKNILGRIKEGLDNNNMLGETFSTIEEFPVEIKRSGNLVDEGKGEAVFERLSAGYGKKVNAALESVIKMVPIVILVFFGAFIGLMYFILFSPIKAGIEKMSQGI